MALPQATKIDALTVQIYPTNKDLGDAAAAHASRVILGAVRQTGGANIILATGNSQLTFLDALWQIPGIPWEQVRVFHMDEYVGLNPQHPASFHNFLLRHLLEQVKPRAFYPVPGQSSDSEKACREYEVLLHQFPADLCVLGIGENGHLAFNDPPYADFQDPAWVKVVRLAEESRRQQVGEGHFAALEEVPTLALTLTIPALLSARRVLAVVPEGRKARAVRQALRGPLSPGCPASILRNCAHATLFLDVNSAAGAFQKGGQ
jgi:glucosamine-6-phosphate deaminase